MTTHDEGTTDDLTDDARARALARQLQLVHVIERMQRRAERTNASERETQPEPDQGPRDG